MAAAVSPENLFLLLLHSVIKKPCSSKTMKDEDQEVLRTKLLINDVMMFYIYCNFTVILQKPTS